MIVNCYSVYDAKLADYHMCIYDIKDEGAVRQFVDVLSDKNHRWARHPEDYSLWFVGSYDTASGELVKAVPRSLVSAAALQNVLREPAG